MIRGETLRHGIQGPSSHLTRNTAQQKREQYLTSTGRERHPLGRLASTGERATMIDHRGWYSRLANIRGLHVAPVYPILRPGNKKSSLRRESESWRKRKDC